MDLFNKIRFTAIAALLSTHLGLGIVITKYLGVISLFFPISVFLALIAGFILYISYRPKYDNGRLTEHYVTVDWLEKIILHNSNFFKKYVIFFEKFLDILILLSILSFFIGYIQVFI